MDSGPHAHGTHAVENPGYTRWLMSQIEALDHSVYSPIGSQRQEEPAAKPRGGRELMLHFNALLPIGVVYFLLVTERNIVAAILGFQFICLFSMPLIYIATMPPSADARSGGGFAIYQRVLRRLLRNWQKQLKFAIAGFLLFTIVGFCAYLAVHTLINTGHVVKVAKSDGLDSKVPYTPRELSIALLFAFRLLMLVHFMQWLRQRRLSEYCNHIVAHPPPRR